jgi:hypothetical protein
MSSLLLLLMLNILSLVLQDSLLWTRIMLRRWQMQHLLLQLRQNVARSLSLLLKGNKCDKTSQGIFPLCSKVTSATKRREEFVALAQR